MKFQSLKFPEVILVEFRTFEDSRGFFAECYRRETFEKNKIPNQFVQYNRSYSAPKVIRGLHVQLEPPQGKLIQVFRGHIWDVVVDVRKNSKTFGQYTALELDEQQPKALWIPPGFAHGFCVLGSEPAHVFYSVDNYWSASGEKSIRWNDPAIGIKWPISDPILSDKDRTSPTLSEVFHS